MADANQANQPKYLIRSEINKRENNEDSFHIVQLTPQPGNPPITVLAIADGMGGHAHGEDVSREALRKISMALYEQICIEPTLNNTEITTNIESKFLSQALQSALEQTNEYVKRMAKNNLWGKAGSTIVIALIQNNQAIVTNLGDSPLFHYQAKHHIFNKITTNHTIAEVLLKTGIITAEMAKYHEGRNQLEFYLGCDKLPTEPPAEIALANDDILLLCSDGISSKVEQAEIAAIFPNHNLEEIATELITKSQQAGETDNQTLILWQHQTNSQTHQANTVIQPSETIRQH